VTTTHIRRDRHDWGTLLAGLIALTALAAAVLLAISLAPASAETPAERCKRETTAYNNAWKNSWAASHPGKKPSDAPKPPVPYKCGGNNNGGPPPTVAPTTTPDTPAETTAPTTKAPDDSSGPAMNAPTAPTERREIEHPGAGQKPIGTPSIRSHQRPSAAPSSTKAETSSVPSHKSTGVETKTPRTNSNPLTPKNASVDKYSGGPDESVSDPTSDACKYCTRDETGNVVEGPANSDDGWRNDWGCKDGTHSKANFPIAKCYTDYDYNIVNVKKLGVVRIPGDRPIAVCQHKAGLVAPPCSKSITYSTTESVSTSTENSIGGSLEVKGVGIEGSHTTTKGREIAIGQSTQDNAGYPENKIPKGYEVVFYQQYIGTAYQIQKVDTRTGQIVSYTDQVSYVPIAGTEPVLQKIGTAS